MNEFSFKTSKGEMFKSMLKRPETAKLIKEALNSPLGSTSRVRAKKIFSIMNKLNEHNSGMGGPGNMFSQEQSSSQSFGQPNSNIPKGMIVFNKIPKPRISYGKPLPVEQPMQSNSQVLNSMVKNNTMPGQNTLSTTVGSAVSRNNLMGTAPRALRGGMGGPGFSNNPIFSNIWDGIKIPQKNDGSGGPGYDGRGGLWDSIKNTASNAWEGTKNVYNKYISKPYEEAKANPVPNNSINNAFSPDFWNNSSNNSSSNNTPSNNTQSYSSPSNNNWWAGSPAASVSSQPTEWWRPTAANNTTDYSKMQSSASNPTPVVDKYGVADWSQTTVKPNAEQMAYWAPLTSPITGVTTNKIPVLGSSNNPENQQEASNNNQLELGNLPNVAYSMDKDSGSIQLHVSNGELGGQCGHFVNNYLGNERPFGDNYYGENGKQSKINSRTPQVGAIAIIPLEGAAKENGHVAVVESINADGSLNIVESNGDGRSEAIGRRTISQDSVEGYYIPGQPPSGTNLAYNSDVQSYLNAKTGPLAYGLNKAREEMGGSLQDVINKNREDIFAQFNINQQNAEIQRMTAEGITLPKDITDYIKGRDEYLVQTDKEIDNFINHSMTNTDMSNPANVAKANSQLNYLYELRGRQNQSYIGYLRDSIEQHTNVLNTKVTKYNSDLEFAQSQLESTNAITVADYENMVNSYGEMYTELKNAPMEAMEMELAALQVIQARKEAAGDASDLATVLSFTEQADKLEKTWSDDNGYLLPGTDLAQIITELTIDDPMKKDFSEAGIVYAYQKQVQRYLDTPNDEDKGITDVSKLEMSKRAVDEFEKLSILYSNSGRNANAEAALEQAKIFTSGIINGISTQILQSDKIENIKAVVEDVPNNWNWFGFWDKFGTRLKPEENFVADFTKRTDSALDESVARAVYAAAQFATNNGANKNGRKAFFYPSHDIGESDNNSPYDLENPFTDVEFANNIAKMMLMNDGIGYQVFASN